MRPGDPNIDMLELMAAKLGQLAEQLVFVGGSTTGLFITDPLLPPVRVTRDVDVITEASSRQDYHQLEESLRALGFSPDMRPEAPICRWQIGDLVLDLMPTDETILGFANRWYPDALTNAVTTRLLSGQIIRTLTPPHFLATKLEAFHGRGNDNYWASHDMEDIVCVIDGRAEIIAEVAASNEELRHYLQAEFATLHADSMFAEAVSGFLPGDAISQTRAPRKAIPDNHVTILRPKASTVDPVYLSVFINSLAGQMQVEQCLHGSSGQIELYPTDIADFTVWLAPTAIQQEIRQAVENSFTAKQRATELLEAAKRAVEIAIEDSETAALAYLRTFLPES